MMIDINGREYQCWHELGHAIACLSWGGEVAFVQLLNEGHSVGQAFARCAPTINGRPMAAPRRFVWNPTRTMAVDRPEHMSAGRKLREGV
jgi:hypothetical protein